MKTSQIDETQTTLKRGYNFNFKQLKYLADMGYNDDSILAWDKCPEHEFTETALVTPSGKKYKVYMFCTMCGISSEIAHEVGVNPKYLNNKEELI